MRGFAVTALALATIAVAIPPPVPARAAAPGAIGPYSHLQAPRRVDVRNLSRANPKGRQLPQRPELARPPAAGISGASGSTPRASARVAVVATLGTNSTIDIYNAVGSVDVIMDLVGYYGVIVPAPSSPQISPLRTFQPGERNGR